MVSGKDIYSPLSRHLKDAADPTNADSVEAPQRKVGIPPIVSFTVDGGAMSTHTVATTRMR